jgi:hypothetical protein
MPESPTSGLSSHGNHKVSNVNRQIPGTIQVEGREFLYLEISSGNEFSELMDRIFISCPTVPQPRSGGVLGENVWITLGDNTVLFGISYKGDLEGWRKKILAFCKENGRRFAIPSSDGLMFADGSAVPFSDCKVVLER